jgi:hypothetical protein
VRELIARTCMRAVRLSSSLARWAFTLVPALLVHAADVHAQPRHATDAEACFEAAERAQPLMKERKLRAASRELSVCARDVCPRAARTDCRAWLDEVTRVQPTLVLRAREARAAGGDVAVDDVRVTVDGETLVPQRIDETPVPVDPGPHAFHFEHGDFPPVDQRLDLREGEARRIVDIVFRPAGAPAATPPPSTLSAPSSPSTPPPTSPAPPAADREATPAPTLTWLLLGGGAVALGVGITFEATGLSARSNLVSGCGASRTCAQSSVDSAHNQVLVGDIGVGLGVALLAGAAYAYFTRGPAAPSRDAAWLHFGFGPAPGGVVGALGGSL